MNSNKKTKVLFVCLGNICRSPTAHGVFETLLQQQGLADRIHVDSAGTAAYHIGNPPDKRSIQAAASRGYSLSHLRARQVVREDFEEYDYILAMDNENLANLNDLRPKQYAGHLGLFLAFGQCTESEVPDPYYGGAEGFSQVLDLVENASFGLLMSIQQSWLK